MALKHKSRILGHSSNPVCGLSMMEQVRLCAVWPRENWLGSSLNQIQGRTTVTDFYSRALEQIPLRERKERKQEKRGETMRNKMSPMRRGRNCPVGRQAHACLLYDDSSTEIQ